MLRQKTTFERIIEGRVVQCTFDNDLPAQIGKEFCSQFTAFIIQIEEAAAKASKEKRKKEEPKAE